MNDVKHILRYGTNAEQKYIRNHLDTFDILAINSNMAAHSTKAVSSFIFDIMHEDNNKSFIIDPLTHSFQHDLDKIKSKSTKKIKQSIQKLIDAYGEPIVSKINEDKKVTVNDFNKINSKTFCEKVLSFQQEIVTNNIKEEGIDEYLEYDSDDTISDNYKPYCLIPPYFYIENKEWLDLNIKFLKLAQQLEPDQKICPQIVISLEKLVELKEEIITEYSANNVECVLLWLDNFEEHKVEADSISQYIHLLEKFRESNIKVINLYGSFFSILLTSESISKGPLLYGVGHGLEYGEYRAVVPVGGGLPTNKYYFYDIHRRVNYLTMTRYLEGQGYFNMEPKSAAKKYYNEICSCIVCKDNIKEDIRNFRIFENTKHYEITTKLGTKISREYASQTTKEICVTHYLRSKNREFVFVKHIEFNKVLEEIESFKTKLEQSSANFDMQYFDRWLPILKKQI